MTDITTCQVSNEIDKEIISLCTEWFDFSFKVTILSANGASFFGEMITAEVNSFAETFNKTSEEYLQETRSILSGKDSDVNFFLQDMTFKWKRKVWNLGIIYLQPVPSIEFLADILQKLLVRYVILNENVLKLEKKNKELESNRIKLNAKLEDMINIKSTIERELYEKFLVILNTKKRKIRELRGDLGKKMNAEQSIYDACTDESEMSDNDRTPNQCTICNDSLVTLKFGDTSRSKNEMRNIVKDSIISESGCKIQIENGKRCLEAKKGRILSSKKLIKGKQTRSTKKSLNDKMQAVKPRLCNNANFKLNYEDKKKSSSIERKCREKNPFDFTVEEDIPHLTLVKDKDVTADDKMKLDEYCSPKASTSKCSNNQYSWNPPMAREASAIHMNESKVEVEEKVKETIQRFKSDASQLNLIDDESEEDLFLEY